MRTAQGPVALQFKVMNERKRGTMSFRQTGQNSPSNSRRLPKGFTIIELMIAFAIISVLAMIAFPSYESYRERGRVAQAMGDIGTMAVDLTRYYADKMRYPDSLADIGKAGLMDPWGHAYQYLSLSPIAKGMMGQVRKDKNLVPINSDFDLYSMGKDGASVAPLTAKASRDDVVRANNGRFIGLARDY